MGDPDPLRVICKEEPENMSVKMVDVGGKEPVDREAAASGTLVLKPSTIDRIRTNQLEKGDALGVARVAAIQAVKHTPDIILLCHPIPIEHVAVEFSFGAAEVKVTVKVKAHARTGVEMEALTGASAALLAIWDMTKKYEKDSSGQYPSTSMNDIRVLEKRKGTIGACLEGGGSGTGEKVKGVSGGESGHKQRKGSSLAPDQGSSDAGV